MTRFHDWPTRLDRFLSANLERPFAWGTWDCCLWSASAIEAMTGEDIAASCRDAYGDAEGAVRVCIAACGSASLEAMAAHIAGLSEMREVPALMAQRGDMVALAPQVEGFDACLGIVDLTGRQAMALTDGGLVRVDLSFVRRAWRVG